MPIVYSLRCVSSPSVDLDVTYCNKRCNAGALRKQAERRMRSSCSRTCLGDGRSARLAASDAAFHGSSEFGGAHSSWPSLGRLGGCNNGTYPFVTLFYLCEIGGS